MDHITTHITTRKATHTGGRPLTPLSLITTKKVTRTGGKPLTLLSYITTRKANHTGGKPITPLSPTLPLEKSRIQVANP